MDDDLERYREAMRRLRHPNPDQGLEELPEDPDTEHVPEALRELDASGDGLGHRPQHGRAGA